MTHEHLKSLKRLRKKYKEAMDSNLRLIEAPEIKGTPVTAMYLIVANIFGTCMNMADDEIKHCKETK